MVIFAEILIYIHPTLQIFYVDEDGNRQHDKSASHNPEELMQWIKRTTDPRLKLAQDIISIKSIKIIFFIYNFIYCWTLVRTMYEISY